MATRRRKVTRRRKAVARAAVNPRRRRRRVRRHNPVVARRSRRASAVNPRHKRRHSRRRRNPSAMKIGTIFKDMIYGAGGAVATRVLAGVAAGFIPAGFASSPFAPAVTQAAVAATLVRWGGKKFLGPGQGDLMMMGGLISAGLALADAYLPNLQQSLTGIIRLPVTTAAQAALPVVGAGAGVAGYRDVYDVPDSAFAGLRGFGDVEDVPANIFGGEY